MNLKFQMIKIRWYFTASIIKPLPWRAISRFSAFHYLVVLSYMKSNMIQTFMWGIRKSGFLSKRKRPEPVEISREDNRCVCYIQLVLKFQLDAQLVSHWDISPQEKGVMSANHFQISERLDILSQQKWLNWEDLYLFKRVSNLRTRSNPNVKYPINYHG